MPPLGRGSKEPAQYDWLGRQRRGRTMAVCQHRRRVSERLHSFVEAWSPHLLKTEEVLTCERTRERAVRLVFDHDAPARCRNVSSGITSCLVRREDRSLHVARRCADWVRSWPSVTPDAERGPLIKLDVEQTGSSPPTRRYVEPSDLDTRHGSSPVHAREACTFVKSRSRPMSLFS